MIGWLFQMADSKTALICFSTGSLIVLGLGFSSVRQHFGKYVIAGLLACAAFQLSFHMTESLVSSVGRDMTLTGRTELWESVLSMRVNPWIGAGFESFWLGPRLTKLAAEYYF